MHVKNQKQRLVARSSTASELISLVDFVADVLWSQRLLQFLVPGFKPPTIHHDNQSTIHMANLGRGGKTGKAKHFTTRYVFVQQQIDNRDIQIAYLPTHDVIADLLRTPLGGHIFHYRCAKLLPTGLSEQDHLLNHGK